MNEINITKLKKSAKRSWKDAFQGKEFLGDLPAVGEKELPYYVFQDHIEHLENMVVVLEEDSFRYPIVHQQLVEAKLSFIFRYEWEFGSHSHPFEHKWIYKKYQTLKSERNLSNYLLN